jgi:hypothetical protein
MKISTTQMETCDDDEGEGEKKRCGRLGVLCWNPRLAVPPVQPGDFRTLCACARGKVPKN